MPANPGVQSRFSPMRRSKRELCHGQVTSPSTKRCPPGPLVSEKPKVGTMAAGDTQGAVNHPDDDRRTRGVDSVQLTVGEVGERTDPHFARGVSSHVCLQAGERFLIMIHAGGDGIGKV